MALGLPESPKLLKPESMATRVVGAVLLLLLLRLLLAITLQATVATISGFTDFEIIYNAAAHVRHHEPMYSDSPDVFSPTGYCYPPTVALLLSPLVEMPHERLKIIWAAVLLSCLVASMAAFALSAGIGGYACVPLAIIMMTGFRYVPTTKDLFFGNINIMLVTVVCAAYWAATRGHLRTLGVIIAIGALWKTWMIGLLIYPILNRDWRTVMVAMGTVVAAMVAMFGVVGFDQWPMFVRATLAGSDQPMMSHSISGAARTLFCYTSDARAPLLASQTAYWVFRIAASAVVATSLGYLWIQRGTGTVRNTHLRLGVVVSALILLLPVCHISYFLLLLPVLWTHLATPLELRNKSSWTIFLVALGCYLAQTRFTRASTLRGESPASPLVLCSMFAVLSTLWAITVWALWYDEHVAAPRRARHGALVS